MTRLALFLFLCSVLAFVLGTDLAIFQDSAHGLREWVR